MRWAGPFELVNPEGAGPLAIVCDHASNAVPEAIGDLGVSAQDMRRHIAWDIGAAGVARLLADAFDSPAVLCGTSRLAIDCNRQLADPTLIPASSDGTRVPANEGLTADQRQARIDAYFTPYHDACRRMLGTKCESGRLPLFVSVHSMTDRMGGAFRPWEIALSSNGNRRATDPALAALARVPGLVAGDNQPYSMEPGQDYSTPEHALSRGLDYLQVEFRQDLVADVEGEARLASIFAEAIRAALAACNAC
jgi:predicted N-formylglutamate amidohydrolase